MRLLIVFFLIPAIGICSAAKSQQVTLSLKQASIRTALQEISKQTGYRFLYSREALQNTGPVTLQVKGLDVDEALNRVLAGSQLTYRKRNRTITIMKASTVPILPHVATGLNNITVTGAVRDSTEALQGVTVMVKGEPGKGTTTDADGKYSITVAESATLVFRLIGYKELLVPVAGRKIIDVLLAPADHGLNEVVILGFGQTQKKIAQTGSMASITTKELKQSPVANITNALAGRLPGLITVQRSGEPGKDMPNLYIRGISTLNNSNPLITIDGVQKDYSAISLLDPNEIETVTILKDASATALYGVKGANGVIIVTTRRGVSGKPAINFSIEQALQDAVRLPKFLGSYENALLANEAYRNDNPTGKLPYSDEAVEAFRTGSDPYRYPNVDWMKEMFKTSRQTKANFNISGGSKHVRYFVNAGYLNQDGIYKAQKTKDYDPNAHFNRYNFRSNIDIDFDEDFSIGLKLYGAIEDRKRSRYSDADLFWTAMMMPPDNPVRYPTGYYAKNTPTNNPVWLLNESGYMQDFNSSLSGMFSATRKLNFITKGLSLKGNFSFDGYFRNSLNREKATPFAVYTGSGDYNDVDSYTYFGEYIPLSAPNSSYSQSRDVWTDLSLNYQRSFGKHEVIGLLLANRTQRVIASEVPYVSQGLVGRLAYNYAYKYFFEIDAGYNGTDNFAKGKRYGLFPAVSAGWIVSEEPFMAGTRSIIDFLKVRGSVGLVGNDQLGNRRWLFNSEYAAAGGYAFGGSLQGVGGIAEGAMANPDVSWEKARKTNIGVEIKLLKNLLGLNVDLFRENRYNILRTLSSVPGILGVSSSNRSPANIGKVNNKGIEVELTHNYRKRKLSYFINVNGSFARNRIIFQDESKRAYPWMVRTGHPIGQFFGLTAIGFFKDKADIDNSPAQFGKVIPGDLKYKDLNKDGKIDGNDISPIGSTPVPEIFYGLSGGLNWKGIDVSFLLQGAARSTRRMEDIPFLEFINGGSKSTKYHQGRWTPGTAATATYPALHYGGSSNNHRQSTFFMENNNYLRLKNVEIGYSFKNIALGAQKHISSIRIYANGMNLFTWTPAKLLDPENTGASYVYPPMRIFNFGVSANF